LLPAATAARLSLVQLISAVRQAQRFWDMLLPAASSLRRMLAREFASATFETLSQSKDLRNWGAVELAMLHMAMCRAQF
jgi:hypothetical protein